jgi:peptide deformylase
MSILKIITIPDKKLRETSSEVTVFDKKLLDFIDDMIDTLRSKPGLGLAAPQVGANIRIILIESRGVKDEDGNVIYENIPLKVLINPEITKFSRDKIEMEEGCFSVPNVFGPVTRPKKIKVTAQDRHGKKISINASGLLSRVIQHEVDHLNGVLFIDLVEDKTKLREIRTEEEIQG